jgi:NAD-reducing hydrogenase large subunit
VPGGVREPLSPQNRDQIRSMLPEAFDIVDLALKILGDVNEQYAEEAGVFGDFPSLFMGLVTPDGGLEHYDGLLRVTDSNGEVLEEVSPEHYRDIIDEATEPWSYLKFPFYKPYSADRFAGMYRVGPLARLNVCTFAGTPKADHELRRFRQLASYGKPVTSSFHYHYARLIEIVFSLEKMAQLLDDSDIVDTHVRSQAGVNQTVGIGVSEAPRGTLFHEYHVNDQGILQKVNMIIATGQNNMAMNETVRQIAHAYIKGDALTEGLLNRIEAGIRCYDPCLSCSTHALGHMPMHVQLVAEDGQVVDEVFRN